MKYHEVSGNREAVLMWGCVFQGRAKAREAEYVILVEEEHYDQFETELKTYHDIERVCSTPGGQLTVLR